MKRIVPIVILIILLSYASCTQPTEPPEPPKPQELVTVTFFDNSGVVTTRTLNKGQSLGSNLPDVTPITDFTFKGWNTKADGTGQFYDETTPINDNINLYEIWEYDGYTISFVIKAPYGGRLLRTDNKIMSNPYSTMSSNVEFRVMYSDLSSLYVNVKTMSAKGATLQFIDPGSPTFPYFSLSNFTSKNILVELELLN